VIARVLPYPHVDVGLRISRQRAGRGVAGSPGIVRFSAARRGLSRQGTPAGTSIEQPNPTRLVGCSKSSRPTASNVPRRPKFTDRVHVAQLVRQDRQLSPGPGIQWPHRDTQRPRQTDQSALASGSAISRTIGSVRCRHNPMNPHSAWFGGISLPKPALLCSNSNVVKMAGCTGDSRDSSPFCSQ
jgi:hypothetical protein